MANCAASGVAIVRCAGMEKLCEVPVPMRNPNAMNETMTRSFVAVRKFCTRDVALTPTQFRMVKIATREQATVCAPPILRAQPPEPKTKAGFDCFSEG